MNKLKYIITLALALACNAEAELFTWISNGTPANPVTNNITVSSNQIFSPTWFDTNAFGGDTKITISNGTNSFSSVSGLFGWNLISYGVPLVISGPATISIVSAANSLFNYTIVDKYPATVSSTSVVIPSDTAGNVQILMETSQDLITWTPCLPGAYGNNATNRFFRVRATQ